MKNKINVEEIASRIDKEEFTNYYNSHNLNDTRAQFKVSYTVLNKLLVFFNIQKKDKSQTMRDAILLLSDEKKALRLQRRKQTKLEKYGNPFFYNVEKRKRTCLEKYGVENVSENKEVAKKIKAAKNSRSKEEENIRMEKFRQTNIIKYGAAYPSQSKICMDKIRNTCQEKYGVQYPCMRKEARIKGSNSHTNQAFDALLTENNLPHELEFPIDRKSYDFRVDKTLIEIDPSITHNSNWTPFREHEGLPTNYHQEKSKLATENGYNCIHVWDWDNWDKIIQLIQPKERIYARKCEIKEPTIEEAKQFINQNHLQNYIKDQIRIGLYYNNELVSIMAFGKPRYNKKYNYELLRYCYTKQVVGGAEKLFHYFIKNYNPDSIISYCDLSKFTGKVYEKLGFRKGKKANPSIHWFNVDTKKHITNNLLNQRGFDQLLGKEYGCYGKGTSNTELMLDHGFVQVYDCGQQSYYWNK